MREVDEDDHALDDSLNVGESRDLDNRMCCDKILSLLKDHIMKENISVKQAFGLDTYTITTDIAMEKEDLKYKIKSITGRHASYDEITKAIDHLHKVSFEKKRER